jgi:indolepyruvate ferredoxin oxidoreductase alpha subunit
MYNDKIMKNIQLLSGDEAIALGAWEAGVNLAASYPGTPATDILEALAEYDEVNSQWSVNEKVAFEVALGASIAGARALYASKHVGLNVAMDPLMTAAYTGITGGFVVVVADDPGMHSSQNEQDNRLVAQFSKLPMLEPSSAAEAYKFARAAFDLSEQFDTPVILRITTRIAHTKESVEVEGTRAEHKLKEFKINAPKYVMVPANAYKKHIELENKLIKLAEYAETTPLNTVEMADKELGFITSGVTYQYVKEAYPSASVLKLGFSYPFCDKKIKDFCSNIKKVVVAEELEPFIENHVKSLGVEIIAKHPSYRIGEFNASDIPKIVAGEVKVEVPSTTRKPLLCAGCPHRATFLALKKNKAIVAGDIGCYTLGASQPIASMHTTICMGGGVTVFEGMSHILKKGVVGVLGDSTFVHSGITGLINAAYNKVTGLVVILDNSITAMTGAQQNPSTGFNIKNEPTKKLILEDVARACGADVVEVIESFDDGLELKIKELMNNGKLSVLISRHPCKLISKIKKTPPHFHQDKCTKCYACLNIDCPALSKTEAGFIENDKSVCTGCNLCVKNCKFGALSSSH